jgi:cellulose synthase/poly-beta-1,6-N-acetylglucosamine synthase-like glycosyltransferase
MDPLLFICLTAAGLMLLTHWAVVAGIMRARLMENARRRSGGSFGGRISIVVPARDEEENLPALFAALDRQTRRDLEIVLVDDRSTDRTPEMLDVFRSGRPGMVQVVHVRESAPAPNPKQRALEQGVLAASGDVFLFTDADCAPGPDWASGLADIFADPGVGLVFSAVAPADRTKLLACFQEFDHLFRYFYTAGCAGLGLAAGGFGNSMAIRRAALEGLGGYQGLRYSPTEDAQLVAQVRAQGAWKIVALTRPAVQVRTRPQPTWSGLLQQSLRWNAGGIFAPDALTAAGYRWVMLFLAAGVLLLPAGLFCPPLALVATGAFLSMLHVGLAAALMTRPGRRFFLTLLPHIVMAMCFYSLVTILTLAGRPFTWKQARMHGRGP